MLDKGIQSVEKSAIAGVKIGKVVGEPVPDLMPAIHADEIVFVVKRSRYERDKEALGLTHESLMSRYASMGESGERVLSSHLRQEAAEALCRELASPGNVIKVEDLEQHLASNECTLVVAVGGDDFFKLVSHHVTDSVLLAGINSDPGSSKGFLLTQEIGQLPSFLTKLDAGRYEVKEWTQLRLKINGEDYGRALNDIVLAKRDFFLMSRHQLEYRGVKVVQSSSGLLVSTGVGSTGWYTSGGLYLGTQDRSFPPTSRAAAFELLSPWVSFVEEDGERKLILPDLVEGKLEEDEVLTITSLNDDEAVVARDSLEREPFPRGTVVEISIDPVPLKVVTLHPFSSETLVNREQQKSGSVF